MKKCILYATFRNFLGHVVCKQGLLVDPANIIVIVNFKPLELVRQLRKTLVHTRYYRNFIKGYAHITTLMEKLLNKEAKFQWNQEC
jgi:hypothetical protein